jgi:hypothetical protein
MAQDLGKIKPLFLLIQDLFFLDSSLKIGIVSTFPFHFSSI